MTSTDTSSKTKSPSASRGGAPASKRTWQVLQRSAYNPDGSLWFPTRLTEEWLEDQRATLGPWLFSSQYLNEPVAQEDRRFQPEWIIYKDGYVEYAEGRLYLVLAEDGKLRPLNVFTTVDPAISDRRYADFTGIVTIGAYLPDRWIVLSARRVRGGAHVVLDEIVREIRTWRPAIIGVETVAYQKALKEFLIDRLNREDLRISIAELKTGTGRSKRARIEGLVPYFSQGRIIIKKGVGKELEFELLSWTPAAEQGRDDLIDALSHQVNLAFPAGNTGQLAHGADWFDLPPDERKKIRRERDLMQAGFGTIRTGYGDSYSSRGLQRSQ